MQIKQLIYHSRPINLFIVAVTQLIILFFLFWNGGALAKDSLLPAYIYLGLIACTMIITLGGYLINDYFDYEIDAINKINTSRFKKPQLLTAYFLSVVVGFCLAIYLAKYLGVFRYLYIYIVAVLCLFLYGSHLKRLGLVGNVVVSLFSSLVIAVIWALYNITCPALEEAKAQVLILFMSFIFLSSMAREIIKDCQDFNGDSKFGLKTLPIRIGLERAAIFAILFMGILILVCGSWLYFVYTEYPFYVTIPLAIVIAISLITIRKTFTASSSSDYKEVSSILKSIMGLGIIYLLMLSFYI